MSDEWTITDAVSAGLGWWMTLPNPGPADAFENRTIEAVAIVPKPAAAEGAYEELIRIKLATWGSPPEPLPCVELDSAGAVLGRHRATIVGAKFTLADGNSFFPVILDPLDEDEPLPNILADAAAAAAVVNGCTDATAFNYDAAANTDDGSCVTSIVNGCTNCVSSNYNALANTDDGTCGNVTPPAIPQCPSASCFGDIKNVYNSGQTSNAKKMYQMAKAWVAYNNLTTPFCYAGGWPCKVLFNKEENTNRWYVVNMYYNAQGNNAWGVVEGDASSGWGAVEVIDWNYVPAPGDGGWDWTQIYS